VVIYRCGRISRAEIHNPLAGYKVVMHEGTRTLAVDGAKQGAHQMACRGLVGTGQPTKTHGRTATAGLPGIGAAPSKRLPACACPALLKRHAAHHLAPRPPLALRPPWPPHACWPVLPKGAARWMSASLRKRLSCCVTANCRKGQERRSPTDIRDRDLARAKTRAPCARSSSP
jgi:hypothetical protein